MTLNGDTHPKLVLFPFGGPETIGVEQKKEGGIRWGGGTREGERKDSGLSKGLLLQTGLIASYQMISEATCQRQFEQALL